METSEVKHELKYPDHCMPYIVYKQARESRIHQNEEIESLGNVCIKKYIKIGRKWSFKSVVLIGVELD